MILDTNVLVSRLLAPRSQLAEIVRRVETECQLYASPDTLTELESVLAKPKFAPFLSAVGQRVFLQSYRRMVELVELPAHTQRVTACRAPDDNRFLELAVYCQADYVITGDQDLLVLSPYAGTLILTAQAFWKHYTE